MSPGNLAYGKQAVQSGTKNTQFSADGAVDGNTTTDMDSGSCSQTTKSKDGAWWQVDLGALHVIHNVTIYNRGDGECIDSKRKRGYMKLVVF